VSGRYEAGGIEVAVEDGVSIVRLLGDLSTQQLLTSRLAALIEGGNPLVFDVAIAKFIDTTVMSAIRRWRRRGYRWRW
jgi:hypothetical protein